MANAESNGHVSENSKKDKGYITKHVDIMTKCSK